MNSGIQSSPINLLHLFHQLTFEKSEQIKSLISFYFIDSLVSLEQKVKHLL